MAILEIRKQISFKPNTDDGGSLQQFAQQSRCTTISLHNNLGRGKLMKCWPMAERDEAVIRVIEEMKNKHGGFWCISPIGTAARVAGAHRSDQQRSFLTSPVHQQS
ncbi:hypothetical protein L1887_29357 [Cichorium endivia]|nr:hypothetical protein L1887_29357 [Cichorium endivia]